MANAGYLIPVKSDNAGGLMRGYLDAGRMQNEYHLKKGDVVGYNFHGGVPESEYCPGWPSIEHVGIAITDPDSNGWFKAIEGNTGDTAGGEVLIRTRNISDVACVGHPKYDSTFSADMVIKTAMKDKDYESPSNKKNKFNQWFYGRDIAGDWCATSICYWFYHTEGDVKMLDTIDVSFCQKTIDWSKVKKAGIKNALIQIGGGDLSSQKDSYFEQNYKNAKAQGIKVGGYWVSYIGDDALVDDYVEDAKLEAKACLSCIKGKTFDYPIYHDLEVKTVQTKKIQAATMAFCAAITVAGYKAGVYASNDFFDAYLDYKAIKAKYSVWLAQWNVSKPSKDCDIWQYSETGSCSGITTTVDYDKMYTSFGPRKEYVTVKVQLAGKNYIPRLGVTLNAYRILKSCGYNVGTKPTDNDPYPAQLSEAVKAYQKKFNLPQTGDLDAATTISMGSFEKA